MVVAVIDTGIDSGHVDLAGGKVIAWNDWVNNRTTPYDDNGHGTHVSGIVAGTGAGNPAYKGVAPGAALIGLKVLNNAGSGSLSNVAAAVDWAVQHKEMCSPNPHFGGRGVRA
jgi:serine protease AprX